MQSFDEALASLEEGERPSILLGNGFSQSWSPEIFNYAKLLEAANFGERNAVLKQLFQRFETCDFEAVMEKLIAAAEVLEAYAGDQQLLTQVKDDQETLKKALIDAIANSHPKVPSLVSETQYVSARRFLSKFASIFTVNYDLLMYWARNKNNVPPENYITDDGFRAKSQWKGYETTEQQVHFLHGGLHIYDTGDAIKKHQCTDDGITIIDQVRLNLADNRFPLFVSEPSYSKKKSRINHNPYLSYCFQAIRRLNGTLFIYGHAINENDKHLFDEVKESKVSRVYVSIYGDENSERNTRTKANAKAFLEHQGLDVMFYDAKSTHVWE